MREDVEASKAIGLLKEITMLQVKQLIDIIDEINNEPHNPPRNLIYDLKSESELIINGNIIVEINRDDISIAPLTDINGLSGPPNLELIRFFRDTTRCKINEFKNKLIYFYDTLLNHGPFEATGTDTGTNIRT